MTDIDITPRHAREELRYDLTVGRLAVFRRPSEDKSGFLFPVKLSTSPQWQREAMHKGLCPVCGEAIGTGRRFIAYDAIVQQKTSMGGEGEEMMPTVVTPPVCIKCVRSLTPPLLEVAPPKSVLDIETDFVMPSAALRPEYVAAEHEASEIVRHVRGYIEDSWEVDAVTLERTGR